MLYSCFPVGFNYGWGVLGRHITLELAGLTETRLLLPEEQGQELGDEIDAYRLAALLPRAEERRQYSNGQWELRDPVIQVASSGDLDAVLGNVVPPYTVGFAVFEQDVLPPVSIERAKRMYRHLAAGSTYCAEVLRRHGLRNVSVALHGVDTTLFRPDPAAIREVFRDSFVVYSGGKFEFRKGQDLVIRYKVLQDRHRDVALINSWFNVWPGSRDTMASSPHIRYFPANQQLHNPWVHALLAANGIDTSRVLTVGLHNNRLLPRIYHNTDVGLFPNRVEGGTNMLLMEYMACGKPAIAAFNSGHKDILRAENCVLISKHRPLAIAGAGGAEVHWSEPDLEETIERLEWAYQNRAGLQGLAEQAAKDMTAFTWRRVAEKLLAAVRLATGGGQ